MYQIDFDAEKLNDVIEAKDLKPDRPAYKNVDFWLSIKGDTYSIVGTVAYLIGVDISHIERREHPQEIAAYNSSAEDKNARIIHHLSSLRNRLELMFGTIAIKMRDTGAGIFTVDDTIKGYIDKLHRDGVDVFTRQTRDLNEYVMELNRLIMSRLDNCRRLFPEWLKWDYLKDFIIMPSGTSKPQQEGTKYQTNRSQYPYTAYVNMPLNNQGNILNNDKRFVTLLYLWHEDELLDQSKVSDASEHTKGRIYKFISNAIKICAVVDAENSDPYRLCATLRQLNEEYTGRIAKVIVIDDEHTTDAWDILEKYVNIPVEQKIIPRLIENKSQVDITVAMAVTREYYTENTDSFILIASDSDYFSLVRNLPEANFIMMVEREKCSPAMKESLTEEGIFYCYLDDFYSGDSEDLQKDVITRSVREQVGSIEIGNISRILSWAIEQSRARITEEEFKRMNQKLRQGTRLHIDDEGNLSLELSFKGML